MEAKDVVERYNAGVKTIQQEIRDYWLNAAFKSGYQWVYYNKASNRMDRFEGDPSRVQATVNRIWPGSRTICARPWPVCGWKPN